MSRSTTRKHFDGDDALRELMSSMLSGRYKEETYLWDVSSVCRSRPESVPKLLALIDRYKRIGRMSAAQHEKVKARIEQVMDIIKPAAQGSANARPVAAVEQTHASDAEAIAEFESDEEPSDDDSEESNTRELAGPRQPAIAAAVVAPSAIAPSAAVAPAPVAAPVPEPVAQGVAAAPDENAPAPEFAGPVAAAETRVMSAPPPLSGATVLLSASRRAHSMGSSDSPSSASAPALPPDLSVTPIGVGTVLHDRYELKQLLGRGGIATVYKAVDRYRVNLGLEDCYVAVKIVQPHPSRPGSVAALGREFHNAQLLSHPNVINVFNIDHAGDASFYTMELLDGDRLSQVVRRLGVLPRRQALAVIRDVGEAMAHAHSRGVVHADLKPHNVMITRIGQVRVLDFGSGTIRSREPWISDLSRDETYREATPAYASCEQLEGWSADPRDDIYALACIAYLLLTGRHPFNMLPSLEARARRLQPRRPPALTGEAWRALRRGLSWTREQRTMAIEDWLRQLGVSDAVDSLPPLPLLHAGRPLIVSPHRLASAAVVVVGLGLAAFTVQHQDDFDWPTLARAHDRLSDAWRGLQSLRDSSESVPAAAVAQPSSLTPQAQPSASLPAPSAHKNGARDRTASAGVSRASRTTTSDADKVPATSAPAPASNPPNVSSEAVVTPVSYGENPANSANPPRLEFSAPSYVVDGTEPAARIVIRRNGSTEGDVNFVWWTEEASAKADVDYASLGRRIERIPSGSDKITVYVPIISTPLRHEITQFYVALGEPGALHSSGPGTRSLVTIDHGS
jgi:serine/threonine protein kinase